MKRIIILLVLLLLISPAMAQEEQAKTGADPTDFITRIEPSYERKRIHQDKSRGDTTDIDLLVIRGDLALRPDLSLRLDLPFMGIWYLTQDFFPFNFAITISLILILYGISRKSLYLKKRD